MKLLLMVFILLQMTTRPMFSCHRDPPPSIQQQATCTFYTTDSSIDGWEITLSGGRYVGPVPFARFEPQCGSQNFPSYMLDNGSDIQLKVTNQISPDSPGNSFLTTIHIPSTGSCYVFNVTK